MFALHYSVLNCFHDCMAGFRMLGVSASPEAYKCYCSKEELDAMREEERCFSSPLVLV